MNRLLLRSLVLVVSGWLVAASFVSGQDRALHPETGRSQLTNFTPADYEAMGQNWAVVEDDRGVIYVGNGSGLLEYDGHSWRLIPLPNRAMVRSLARDASNRIWVGGKRELGYLTADSLGRTVFVSLRDKIPEAHRDFVNVWSTHATNEGIYFRTSGAIFRWDGSTMQTWPAEKSFSYSFVVHDTFYVWQRGVGLMRMERSGAGDALRLSPGGERFADTLVNVMLPFDADRILIRSTEGFFLYDGERLEAFATEVDGLLDKSSIYPPGVVLPNGRFGLGTATQGLVVIDRSGRLVEHVDQKAGLQDNNVWFLSTDRQGNVWLALNSGIARVEINSPFTLYDSQGGLPSKVTAIVRHGGELFTGVGTIGLRRLDRSTRTFRPIESSLTQVFSLLPVGGDLLIAAPVQGVYRIVGERTVGVRRSVASDYRARTLHRWEVDPNVVAVGLTNGLAILRRSAEGWIDEGKVPGLSLSVYTIAEAGDGALWLGAGTDGVARVRLPRSADGGRLNLSKTAVTVFGPEDGLPEGSLDVFRVGDKIYFVGSNETVFRFDKVTGKFTEDSAFTGARSGHPLAVFTLREGSAGRVWIASTYGAPVVANPQSDGTYKFEVLRDFRRARIKDSYPEADGVVWLMGERGLIRYDTKAASSKTGKTLQPLIRRVSLGEDNLLYGGAGKHVSPEIAHGSGEIRFTYAAPGRSGQPLFRTKLEGFGADWSVWSTTAERSYTNLPPGDYLFRIEVEGGGKATYVFTVLPPWYRTWWAYGSYLVLLGLLVFGVHFIQRKRLIKKERTRAEKKRIEDELNIGHRIQMGMLTTDFPKLVGIEVSAALEPAREVGGDLYDVFFLDDQHLCCCVGDVSGKGVPAALFMAISKTLVKAVASHQRTRSADELAGLGWSTGAIMNSVNDELSHDNNESMFVTAFLCIINIKTGKGIYTNSGHNPPYILHAAGDPKPLTERHGPVLGAVEGIEYGEASIVLNQGEQLLIFTDGVTEAFNEAGELFTDARLEGLVSGIESTGADDTVQAVLREVKEFEGEAKQADDITILVLRKE